MENVENKIANENYRVAVIAFGIVDTVPVVAIEPGQLTLANGDVIEVPISLVASNKDACTKFIADFFDQLNNPAPQIDLVLAE